ncbi:hypothetical protein EKH55_2665 [Sinorhizobium alkalisoli]|nr:hypothetical protein EKH55_2665 [Sinorhizobium alkalisoli]
MHGFWREGSQNPRQISPVAACRGDGQERRDPGHATGFLPAGSV